jgi:hypothetical protein
MSCYNQEVQEHPEIVAQRIIDINPDRIMIWCAQEYAYYEIFDRLFDLLENWATSNNKIVHLITTYKSGYIRPWILAEGTYGILYNFMFAHMLAYPNDTEVDSKTFIYLNNNTIPTRIRPTKLFTCYNHYAHTPRGLLVDLLARDDLIKSGIVTFHYPKEYQWKYHNGSKLINEPGFKIHDKKYAPNVVPKNQTSAFMDIVTESRYDPEEYFLTEKTLKSVMLYRPFLVLSCQGFHKYLVDHFGFELYDEIFDYSFDKEELVHDRVEGIIKNIKHVKNIFRDTKKLNKIYDSIRPKLLHNRDRVEKIFSNKDLIVPKSLQFLMEDEDITILNAGYSDLPDYMIKMGWSNIKLNNA